MKAGKYWSSSQEAALARHAATPASPDGWLLSMHPAMANHDPRSAVFTTAHRTFVIETDKLPRQQQLAVVRDSGMPVSACVWSGNRSYHWTVVLDGLPPTWSRHHHAATCRELEKRFPDFEVFSDLAKATRFPASMRLGTGQEQRLVSIDEKRVPALEFFRWFGLSASAAETFMMTDQTPPPPPPVDQSKLDAVRARLAAYLEDHNVSGFAERRVYAPCPACRDEGADSQGQHLLVHHDGKFQCVANHDHNKPLWEFFSNASDAEPRGRAGYVDPVY
jgi:hypothetical protein